MNHDLLVFATCAQWVHDPLLRKSDPTQIFYFYFFERDPTQFCETTNCFLLIWQKNYQKLIFGAYGVGYGGKLWSINFRIPDHNFLIQKRKKKKKSNFSLAISPSCLLAKNVNLDHDIQLSFLSRSLAENFKKIRKPFILLINKYYFMTL